MDAAYLAWFQERSAWERDRDGPPVGFPALPDIPLGRYTDGEFFELEREHLFGKVWLYAAHDSELPETGSYKLCDIVGSPPSRSSCRGSKTVSPIGNSERKITLSAMPSATRQPSRSAIFSRADCTTRIERDESMEMRLRTST